MQLPEDVWRGQPGQWFFLCTKDDNGQWREHPFKRGKWNDVRKFIEDSKHVDVYWCVHGFSSRRRIKENALGGHWLYADLDAVNPRKLDIKPTIAIESSPGRHVALWKVDEFDEEVNRRLTYATGADPSGWDLTQVLRVPGTRNWKYPKGPTVKTMWANGVNYNSDRLDRDLPEIEVPTGNEETSATKLWDRWEEAMPPWVRREMMAKDVPAGKRSEMLWKLAHTFLEKGVSKREAFIMLKSSPWNKFRGRRNEDEQLEREINKATRRKFNSDKDPNSDFNIEPLAVKDMEDIDWLWYPYLARGEITILEGDPGTYKSMVTEAIAVALCNGDRLTSPRAGGVKLRPQKVLLFDCENSRSKVVIPRMKRMGMKQWDNCLQKEEMFSLIDEQKQVYDAMAKIRPSLVVFDTLNSYFGAADPHKGTEVSQAFQVFADLAREFNCAVLVLRHLTKGGRDKAIYRGMGSITFTGKARIVLQIHTHPDDEQQRVIALTKNNLAASKQSLAFEVKFEPKLKDLDNFTFEWGEYVSYTADDLVKFADRTEAHGGKREDIKKWLRESLTDGPKSWRDLERMLQRHNKDWDERTVGRAAQELNIAKKWEGRVMMWSLPVRARAVGREAKARN